jgi:hypothetical protein
VLGYAGLPEQVERRKPLFVSGLQRCREAVYGWTATTPASTVVMVGDSLSKNKPNSCAGSATC